MKMEEGADIDSRASGMLEWDSINSSTEGMVQEEADIKKA